MDVCATVDKNHDASFKTKAQDASQAPTQHRRTETAVEWASISESKSYPNECDYAILSSSNPGKIGHRVQRNLKS